MAVLATNEAVQAVQVTGLQLTFPCNGHVESIRFTPVKTVLHNALRGSNGN